MIEFLLGISAGLLILSIGFVLYVGVLALISKYFLKKYGAAEISWWT